MLSIPSGARLHQVTLDNPGPPVPDGDGGFTESVVPLTPPTLFARIAPVTEVESAAAGSTVLALATHRVIVPWHPQITMQTRLTFNGRRFSVIKRTNLEERNVTLDLLCAEIT